jgi:hypothetical protein
LSYPDGRPQGVVIVTGVLLFSNEPAVVFTGSIRYVFLLFNTEKTKYYKCTQNGGLFKYHFHWKLKQAVEITTDRGCHKSFGELPNVVSSRGMYNSQNALVRAGSAFSEYII